MNVTIEFYVKFDGTRKNFHATVISELVNKHGLQRVYDHPYHDYTELSLPTNVHESTSTLVNVHESTLVKVVLYDDHIGCRVKFVVSRDYLAEFLRLLPDIEPYLRSKTSKTVLIRNFVCPICKSDKPWSPTLENNIIRLGTEATGFCDYCNHRIPLLSNTAEV